MLDEDTFMTMVSEWQRNRLKDRAYAQPDQLVTAPILDFYDPERVAELRQVERTTYAAYKQMVAAAIADPSLNLASYGRGRTRARGKILQNSFRLSLARISGPIAAPITECRQRRSGCEQSPLHGSRLDFYVGGDPVDTKDSNRALQVKTPVYQWLVRNAARFGFRPYFYEPLALGIHQVEYNLAGSHFCLLTF